MEPKDGVARLHVGEGEAAEVTWAASRGLFLVPRQPLARDAAEHDYQEGDYKNRPSYDHGYEFYRHEYISND